ncbi:MAG: hypothetical protein K6A23_11445 [Butyrivibrio sp.]|nr:hypothetical protein [Butyrivibrio sp.]
MFEDFSDWLDTQLEDGLPDGEGICFNLYEDGDSHWSIELSVSDTFDEEDDEWAAEATYTSDETYNWKQDDEWDDVLEDAIQVLIKYLNNGKFADFLKENYKGIAAGFVDGDLELLYMA